VQLPKAPWLKDVVDIVGPIDNKYLVTYIDYYSSFSEVAITRDITSKSIVKILMNIFVRHGYPEEIVSDNCLFLSTLCRKSWVFPGYSGFLPQGKLTGWVR
jgi:hypothetical protein